LAYKVHFFGPSTLHFSDTTPEESLLGLTERALAELRPRRRGEFADRVSRYCIQKRIPCLNPDEVREEAGISAGLAADRWHPDLRNRYFAARILAKAISEASGGATELSFSDIATREPDAISS
jgi:hypothetical protein